MLLDRDWLVLEEGDTRAVMMFREFMLVMSSQPWGCSRRVDWASWLVGRDREDGIGEVVRVRAGGEDAPGEG